MLRNFHSKMVKSKSPYKNGSKVLHSKMLKSKSPYKNGRKVLHMLSGSEIPKHYNKYNP